MYTRLPCRNTASLIFLFIVSVISIQGHDSFTFVVSVDGTMGRDGSAILLTDSLTRVRDCFMFRLFAIILNSSRQLTCLRGSRVHCCSGTGINDGTGFPDVLLN